jgi:hypothetical protein
MKVTRPFAHDQTSMHCPAHLLYVRLKTFTVGTDKYLMQAHTSSRAFATTLDELQLESL